jgi:hypothetical protein
MKKSIEDKLMEILSEELSASIDREIMKGLIPSIRKEKIKNVIKKIKSSE